MRRQTRALLLGMLLAAGATGCGQQGPLVLPGDARPVERIGPPSDNEQNDNEQNDDEQRDER
jgi:predicted small lipoprotein YifL